MPWLAQVSYFFGGAFLANAIPHFVSGMMGRPFQTPFAKPPGQGLSSSTVNALWGFFNLVVGYRPRLPRRRFRSAGHRDVVALGLGRRWLIALSCRRGGFGRFNGGNAPERSMKAPGDRRLPFAARLQLSCLGAPARSSPTSAPGCSARPRTGWCSPSSPTITPPPSASSWRCSSGRSCCCCPGPASPPTISISASC